MFMGNLATAGVIEKGKVILKLTSRKNLSLNNVLYVPSLLRNLVSRSLLNRADLKIIVEGDKVVLIKNEKNLLTRCICLMVFLYLLLFL